MNTLKVRTIFCVQCASDVDARLTSGKEIYPHRTDLHNIPLWRCDGCGNYVGCHHKTSDTTRPLGVIPNNEIRAARQYIHVLIDPLWKSSKIKRGQVYSRLSKALGYSYHSAEIRTIEQARKIYETARELFSEELKSVKS